MVRDLVGTKACGDSIVSQFAISRYLANQCDIGGRSGRRTQMRAVFFIGFSAMQRAQRIFVLTTEIAASDSYPSGMNLPVFQSY